MSQKTKLKDLHSRLKTWCDDNGDDDLEQLLNELDGEVSTMDDEPPPPDDGNHPKKPGNP